jgi:shikimate dehydrogenase
VRILAAVLGRPIDHSKSPLLHRAAFAALGLTTSEYGRVDLGADELEDFLDSHPDETGFSLTMPLKDRLVKLAAERGWAIDDTAALTGAGNTVVRSGEQTQVANTDVRGIVGAIAPHLSVAEGAESRGAGAGRATILGAGATAASALVACRDLGITEVEFLVRSPDRARRVVELAEQIGLSASLAPLERIGPSVIVISTLPAEAAPQLEWDASFTAGDAHSGNVPSGVALDVAYAEASSFLAAAAAHGLLPVDGTAMLVEQAVAQSEMFVAAAAMPFDLPTGQELRHRISQAMYSALRDTAAASRD